MILQKKIYDKVRSLYDTGISGLTSLTELNLSRCSKVMDAGIKHLLSVANLEKLWLSQTGVTETGISLLASLKNLSLLDLGGLPVTDHNLSSLQVLDFCPCVSLSIYIVIYDGVVTNLNIICSMYVTELCSLVIIYLVTS